ncbi:unnamed protein product [Adineta ricciae]|uniref:G-protein coupled receptors family 1 profile domain-containing protein n=1 Tax=Adineta ricciae TaxID=249248 RepID=A0A815ELV0_ADIRI|nr:unnamed protein product [Adineta ricciae]
MGFILVNLTVRIISVGYGYDLTRTSVVWCKVRQYLLLILGLISFMLSCLAVIDQFLATSRNANLRRVSNISWSHRIVCVVLIVCCLYGIPALVFVDISPNLKICVIANANYAIYISVHVLSFTCIIPVLVTVIFGYLTYRSIHSTRVLVEQQVDRQLVRMVLSEVAIIVVSITPYGVNTVYSLITSGSSIFIGSISNATFIATNIIETFYNLTCQQCTCEALNISVVGWNYFTLNNTCQLINNYTVNDPGLINSTHSIFFFRQIPYEPTSTTSKYSSIQLRPHQQHPHRPPRPPPLQQHPHRLPRQPPLQQHPHRLPRQPPLQQHPHRLPRPALPQQHPRQPQPRLPPQQRPHQLPRPALPQHHPRQLQPQPLLLLRQLRQQHVTPSCSTPSTTGQIFSFNSGSVALTTYTYNAYTFIANNSFATLTFVIKGEKGGQQKYWLLDDISVTYGNTGVNVLANGDFETGNLSNWTQFCATNTNCQGTNDRYGQITGSSCRTGSFCYVDKCDNYDYLVQSFPTVRGGQYIIVFYLKLNNDGAADRYVYVLLNN